MNASTEKKAVQVLFPCIHGLATGQLITINCFPSAELKGTIKAVTGVDEEIARRVIGSSRFNESDGRAGIGVMALFSNPFFTGESYGLALAVADKLARFEAPRQWTEIYATGSVPADGCGKVTAINGFQEKIELLLEKAKPGSLFLYPKNNLFPSPDHVQEKLKLLLSKGVDCIAVTTVDDLQGKLWISDTAQARKPVLNITAKAARIPATVWQTFFGLVLAGIASFLVYLVLSAPTGDLPPALVDQNTQDKKKITAEKKESISHQEVKQEKGITENNINPAVVLTPDNNYKDQEAGKQRQALVIESTDTDSSQY